MLEPRDLPLRHAVGRVGIAETLYEHFIQTMSDESLMSCFGEFLIRTSGFGVIRTRGSFVIGPSLPSHHAAIYLICNQRCVREFDGYGAGGLDSPLSRREFLDRANALERVLSMFGYSEYGENIVQQAVINAKTWPEVS